MHATLNEAGRTSDVWWLQGDNADFSYKLGAKRDRKRKGSKLPRQSLAAARALAHGKEISAKSKLREVSSKVEQSRLRLL